MRIDLHSHSSVSDGTDPPEAVVQHAAAAGLDILALTDHDTVGGLDAAESHLPAGLTLVPGMELSCVHQGAGVHLLAYLFDARSPELAGELRRIRADRTDRAGTMVRRLQKEGIDITWERVRDIAMGGLDPGADGRPSFDSGESVVGRPHIAQALVEAGVAEDVQDAFERWIGSGRPGYVERYALEPVRAVGLVRSAGGVSVLAHPARSDGAVTGTVPESLVARMAGAGLGGIEADHPAHGDAEREHWRDVAKGLDLAVTGSSDDHGELTGHRIGCRTTDPEEYARLIAPATGARPMAAR